MDSRERIVSFYDLRVQTSFTADQTDAPPLSTDVALSLAKAAAGSEPYVMGAGKVQISLDDWQIGNGGREHYLLFSRSDASLPDFPLKNNKTRARRMAGKTGDEGMELTAHVVIKLGLAARDPALLLLTSGTGIPSYKIAVALSRLLRLAGRVPENASHFLLDNPSGEKDKPLKTRSRFALEGHQSATLGDILRGGQLEGLELISETDEELDTDKRFVVSEKILKVEVRDRTRPISLKRFRELIGASNEDIDRARIRFRKTGDKRAQTQTLDVAALEAAFVKRDRVVFSFPVHARYEKVSSDVIDTLRRLL